MVCIFKTWKKNIVCVLIFTTFSERKMANRREAREICHINWNAFARRKNDSHTTAFTLHLKLPTYSWRAMVLIPFCKYNYWLWKGLLLSPCRACFPRPIYFWKDDDWRWRLIASLQNLFDFLGHIWTYLLEGSTWRWTHQRLASFCQLGYCQWRLVSDLQLLQQWLQEPLEGSRDQSLEDSTLYPWRRRHNLPHDQIRIQPNQ